ncbi:hypothetical protein MPH61_22645 [Peribacillus muralis]|uniref:hypothetical protein n=1 Tax=Peribacillus muralis TaxID=264697 RepID=UPI001F4DA3A3|nr:hypothetical protein [Peribacillus muralis]MCK1995380.1 hypothetical protein [Peribacillus muralis]MCK2015911.1 hypothetical protein [Peribacillus muralis]
MMRQILFALKEMKRFKFIRLHADLRHIIVTKEEELRAIDHYSSYTVRYRPDLKIGSITIVLWSVKRNGSGILYEME